MDSTVVKSWIRIFDSSPKNNWWLADEEMVWNVYQGYSAFWISNVLESPQPLPKNWCFISNEYGPDN